MRAGLVGKNYRLAHKLPTKQALVGNFSIASKKIPMKAGFIGSFSEIMKKPVPFSLGTG